MKQTIGPVILVTVLLGLAVARVAPGLADAIEKSKQKKAMSLVRDIGSLSFGGGEWGQLAEWQTDLCARRTDGGPAAVILSEPELRKMLAMSGASAVEIDELGSFASIEAGTYCNCDGGFLWIKAGDVVWSDGYFISRPSGLSGDGVTAGWKTHPKNCQTDPSS